MHHILHEVIFYLCKGRLSLEERAALNFLKIRAVPTVCFVNPFIPSCLHLSDFRFKDGQKINHCRKCRIQQLSDGTCVLTLAHASPSDSGVYTCIAYNESGRSSTVCTIKVDADTSSGEILDPSMKRLWWHYDKIAINLNMFYCSR